jgi:hypothetical protein
MRLMRKLLPARALNYADFAWWKLRGSPPRTPHLVKQRTVTEYAQRYGLRVLVETGTYRGDMVAAMRNKVDEIYSIEFDPSLAAAAAQNFSRWPNIHILQGDSEVRIPEVLKQLTQPALFWLDAGYYGWAGERHTRDRLDSELNAILRDAQPHIVLIDDAQGFNGQNGAPTREEFQSQIEASFPQRRVDVGRQIFRIVPR